MKRTHVLFKLKNGVEKVLYKPLALSLQRDGKGKIVEAKKAPKRNNKEEKVISNKEG